MLKIVDKKSGKVLFRLDDDADGPVEILLEPNEIIVLDSPVEVVSEPTVKETK